MDVMTAVLTRRSEHVLGQPAPTPQEFGYLLGAASRAPDHGELRPWRWVLVGGEDRAEVGRALAESSGKDAESMRVKVERAPLLAGLVFCPQPHARIPEWEQLAATTAMTTSLMLLLHARGFGSIWRTGAHADAAAMRRLLDVEGSERALGWLYIGTPDPRRKAMPRRQPVSPDGRLRVFRREPASHTLPSRRLAIHDTE
ncbi:nitroreductase [Streptomyces sp. JJ38]|uniref:nitroreductase family protein n=1 Tax=Streptomyces sp. JJ38 TaxID=2738128 RepID=UPI001C587612|nr:nitroreductase [Streptomyces sp. JJ38]MBW1596480.1 nitroreductase [Streptomyces sp. JJ38]